MEQNHDLLYYCEIENEITDLVIEKFVGLFEVEREYNTNALVTVRFEDDEHSNVASESVTVLSHLRNHGSDAFSIVKSLHTR